MKLFIAHLQKFGSREEGATMVEYGLMVALIAVVCLVAVGTLGSSVSDVFTDIATEVAGGAAE
jgi:pilus assembly protein Flp/PilA